MNLETHIPFDSVASFIREWARIPAKRAITDQTRFEEDLGITGDDGAELLDAAAQHFEVELTRDDFGMAQRVPV